MGNKCIIAAGTGRYDHLPPDLQCPRLNEVVESVANLFTGSLSYSRVLEEISTNPTSGEFLLKLDKWFASNVRDTSDWIVLYYSGHGELDGDSLFLLTANSEQGLAPSTAISVERLGQILVSKRPGGEKRSVRNCFLILDTCYSGTGAFIVLEKLRDFFEESNEGLFYILAAALPREEAMAGAQAQALIDSINDEASGGPQQRLIYPDQLRSAINRRLRTHLCFYAALGSSREEPEFFQNPRYVKGLPLGATVADVRRASEDSELTAFWGPVSRGVELEVQPGWYFTGRERVLTEISEWLNDPTDSNMRVLTGRPGTGKSAILAKIVTLSDPEYRKRLPSDRQQWTTEFRAGIVDLAIHAKGKTVQEVVARFAESLAVEKDQPKVLAALRSRERPFHIVIDALDEAREPHRIVRDLLEPIQSFPQIKLLVGSRPEYADKLGSATRLKIDEPGYFERSDLAKYVTERLTCNGQPCAMTPYRDHPQLAADVGLAVAERAYPNFLIARLVAEDLLTRQQPVRLEEIATSPFPSTVEMALDQYLARFGAEEERVRDLLTPLAWSEGLGPLGEKYGPPLRQD